MVFPLLHRFIATSSFESIESSPSLVVSHDELAFYGDLDAVYGSGEAYGTLNAGYFVILRNEESML